MGPRDAIATCLRKSFDFSGCASRSEFWWFAPVGLAFPVISALGGRYFGLAEGPRLLILLAFSLPIISASFRRCRDAGLTNSETSASIGLVVALVALASIPFGAFDFLGARIIVVGGLLLLLTPLIPLFALLRMSVERPVLLLLALAYPTADPAVSAPPQR
ncbi:MAG: DUF805 domain-containing protein [Paracoccaceae bacterium]